MSADIRSADMYIASEQKLVHSKPIFCNNHFIVVGDSTLSTAEEVVHICIISRLYWDKATLTSFQRRKG